MFSWMPSSGAEVEREPLDTVEAGPPLRELPLVDEFPW